MCMLRMALSICPHNKQQECRYTHLEVSLNPEQHVLQLLPGMCFHLELLSLLCTLRFQLSQDVFLARYLAGALSQCGQ